MAGEEGLQALRAQIAGSARGRADEVIGAAEAQAAEMLRQAQEAAEAERRRVIDEARQEAERYRVRALSAAQLEAKRQLLMGREELINRVFEGARQRLRGGLTGEERRAALARLLAEAAAALGGGDLTVRAGPADAQLLAAQLLQEAAVRGTSAGVAASLQPGPPAAIEGGVVVSKEEGRILFDNSFSARLERQSWALRNEVWQALTEAPEEAATEREVAGAGPGYGGGGVEG